MQIPPNPGLVPHVNPTQHTQAASGGCGRSESAAPQYDQLTLSKESAGPQPFHRELAGRLAQEVRTNTTTGAIRELRQQVLSGRYEMDAEEIASRMLLWGGVE